MMWPFALKEAAFRLNRLTIRGDGRSNEATFFNVDSDIIEPSTFHTFGSPCFVLDARLQSGLSTVPKWEPRSRLGIYVGHSPSHAGTVALVLNPTTGHVSPQYHVVFDDHFTTVPFTNKNNTPPNWASLVENSRECVTEEEYDLAQEWLSEEPKTNPNDALTPKASNVSNNPNPTMKMCGSAMQMSETNPTMRMCGSAMQMSETNTCGPDLESPSSSLKTSNEVSNPTLSASEGDLALSAPKMINLSTAGLRRSPRLLEQNKASNSDKGPSTVAYASSSKHRHPFQRPKRQSPRMSFFSVFCSVGVLWSFALSTMPHFFNGECHSFVTRVSDDYERLNGLYDDTINDICHHVKAYTTSNEVYTYKQMLKEDDCNKFFQAIMDKIEVHEKHNYWTLVERNDLPVGIKTIMAI